MMEVWFVLIGIVALVILFPFIRCFFKRLVCAVKIKRICKRKNLVVHPTHILWFLGSKRGKNCDFYIETPTQVLAIKLFGAPRRLSILTFKENGNYFFRSYVALLSYGAGFHIPIDGREKKMPNFDFRYQCEKDWYEKKTRNVLLANPTPMEFRYQPLHGAESIISVGEVVNGMQIYSLQHLLKELENKSQTSFCLF